MPYTSKPFSPSVVFSAVCVAFRCLKCLHDHICLDYWGPANQPPEVASYLLISTFQTLESTLVIFQFFVFFLTSPWIKLSLVSLGQLLSCFFMKLFLLIRRGCDCVYNGSCAVISRHGKLEDKWGREELQVGNPALGASLQAWTGVPGGQEMHLIFLVLVTSPVCGAW